MQQSYGCSGASLELWKVIHGCWCTSSSGGDEGVGEGVSRGGE